MLGVPWSYHGFNRKDPRCRLHFSCIFLHPTLRNPRAAPPGLNLRLSCAWDRAAAELWPSVNFMSRVPELPKRRGCSLLVPNKFVFARSEPYCSMALRRPSFIIHAEDWTRLPFELPMIRSKPLLHHGHARGIQFLVKIPWFPSGSQSWHYLLVLQIGNGRMIPSTTFQNHQTIAPFPTFRTSETDQDPPSADWWPRDTPGPAGPAGPAFQRTTAWLPRRDGHGSSAWRVTRGNPL